MEIVYVPLILYDIAFSVSVVLCAREVWKRNYERAGAWFVTACYMFIGICTTRVIMF